MFTNSRRYAAARARLAIFCLTALALSVQVNSATGSPLTLLEAEQKALAADYGVQAFQARSHAFSEQAIAAESWMDPTISIGTMNLPGNDIDPFNQGMIELKLEQMLPRGDTTQIQRRKSELQSETATVASKERQLTILRDVRLSWWDAWYGQQALQALQNDRHLFESLVAITQSMYSQGRKSQQNLFQAELALSQLDNRIASAKTSLAQSKAQLTRWLGSTRFTISPQLSASSVPLSANNDQALLHHPLVQTADLAINQAEQDIALAEQGYKPQFGIELKYGREQGDMGSMGSTDSRNKYSAMVMMDIPLFTENRQDRQLAASRYRLEASTAQRLDILYQLRGQLQSERARYRGLQDRIQLFKTQLLPQAVKQSEASLKSYQADAGSFSDVIQTYKTRLDITLEYTRLQADIHQSQARLSYLMPDQKTVAGAAKGRTL